MTTSDTMAQAPSESSKLLVQDVIRRLAREMRVGASIADDCQDAIGDDELLEIRHETAVRLQGLDLLSQQLIEIGHVLDRLADEGGQEPAPRTLLDGIRLSDLKQRLVGDDAKSARAVDTELW